MRGLCHTCYASNVEVKVVDGIAVCSKCTGAVES